MNNVHPLIREAVTVFMVEGDEAYGEWLASLTPEEAEEYNAAIDLLADDPNGTDAVDEFIVALALAHPHLAQMRVKLGQYSSGEGAAKIETEILAARIIDRIPQSGPDAGAPWSGKMKNGKRVLQSVFLLVGIRDGEPATLGFFTIPVWQAREPNHTFSIATGN